MKKQTFIISLCLSIALLFYCSKNNNIAGNSSQDGNVKGRLAKAGGAPAAGVSVYFYPVNNNPREGLAKRLAVVDSTVTDADGNYADSLPDGLYNMTAGDDTTGVYQDSIEIAGDTADLPDDTLKPYGSIAGVVKLQTGDDARTVFMLVMGTDKWTAPTDAIGNFSLADMAEGTYSVRILSTLDKYEPLDTTLAIQADTDLVLPDSIELPLRIPKVTGLTIIYDTLKQIVTLTWNKADTAKVKGYNVYRQHVDSTDVKLNVQPITDTVYVDSTGVQDETYIYSVASVNISNEEGIKVSGDSVKITSAFSLVDSIGVGILEQPRDIIVRENGEIYVTDDTTGLRVFNADGEYVSTIACSSFSQINLKRVFKMDEDENGNLYITGRKDAVYGGNGVVLKLSSQDSLLMHFGYKGGTDSILDSPMHIVVMDTFVYVENGNDRKIKVYSSMTGIYLFSFGGAGYSAGQFVEIKGIAINQQNQIITLDQNRIQIFSGAGTYLDSFDLNVNALVGDMRIAPDGTIFVFSPTTRLVYGFNNHGNLSAKFRPNSSSSTISYIDNLGNIYMIGSNSKVYFYNKK